MDHSYSLTLTTSSEARGIGYQLLFNDRPVSYGPDSAKAGATNQFHITDVGRDKTTVEIGLKVLYVQTKDTISPGTADAVATVTFSYQ